MWTSSLQVQASTSKPPSSKLQAKAQCGQNFSHKKCKKGALLHCKIWTKIIKKCKNWSKTQKLQIKNKSKQIITKSNYKSKGKAKLIKMQRKWQKIEKMLIFENKDLKTPKPVFRVPRRALSEWVREQFLEKRGLFWSSRKVFSWSLVVMLVLVLVLVLST